MWRTVIASRGSPKLCRGRLSQSSPVVRSLLSVGLRLSVTPNGIASSRRSSGTLADGRPPLFAPGIRARWSHRDPPTEDNISIVTRYRSTIFIDGAVKTRKARRPHGVTGPSTECGYPISCSIANGSPGRPPCRPCPSHSPGRRRTTGRRTRAAHRRDPGRSTARSPARREWLGHRAGHAPGRQVDDGRRRAGHTAEQVPTLPNRTHPWARFQRPSGLSLSGSRWP